MLPYEFSIEFYQKAFDAKELRRWSNDDGSVHVAEMKIEDALFHLHEESSRNAELSPKTMGAPVLYLDCLLMIRIPWWQKRLQKGQLNYLPSRIMIMGTGRVISGIRLGITGPLKKVFESCPYGLLINYPWQLFYLTFVMLNVPEPFNGGTFFHTPFEIVPFVLSKIAV